MWLKYPLIILLFFFTTLLQASFLPHFNIMGSAPNLVFILFFILIFNECLKRIFFTNEYYSIIFLVILAGIFLDIFSSFHFGVSMVYLFGIYAFIKIITYFIQETNDKYFIFYFIFLFSFSFFSYAAFLNALSFNNIFSERIIIPIGYNLALACLGYYAHKRIRGFTNRGKQLKLF